MNLKMWMSTVGLSAVAVAFFAVAPASAQCNDLLAQSNSDARDPAGCLRPVSLISRVPYR